MKVRMVALSNHSYASRPVRTGETYTVDSEDHALKLEAIGKARRAMTLPADPAVQMDMIDPRPEVDMTTFDDTHRVVAVEVDPLTTDNSSPLIKPPKQRKYKYDRRNFQADTPGGYTTRALEPSESNPTPESDS